LLTLGISGAWIGSLAALEPYRPIFVGLALLFFALAFHRLYFAHSIYLPGSLCAKPHLLKRRRRALWIVTAVVLVLVAIPWFAPLFYSLQN
jgi:mercuric ion transport protein